MDRIVMRYVFGKGFFTLLPIPCSQGRDQHLAAFTGGVFGIVVLYVASDEHSNDRESCYPSGFNSLVMREVKIAGNA